MNNTFHTTAHELRFVKSLGLLRFSSVQTSRKTLLKRYLEANSIKRRVDEDTRGNKSVNLNTVLNYVRKELQNG